MKKTLILVLAGWTLIFASCVEQSTEQTFSDKPSTDQSGADSQTAEDELEELVKEFSTKLDKLPDKDLRKSLAENHTQKLLVFIDKHEGTPAASEAWLHVMAMGSGAEKERAMKFVLSQVAANPVANSTVSQLSEIIVQGEGDYRSTAIERLKKLSENPNVEIAAESLLRLIMIENLPIDIRLAALNRWLRGYVENERTIEIANQLNQTQSEFNELGLKSLAQGTAGEIKTHVVLALANYINRRDSVREYWKDDPQNRLGELSDQQRRYLAAADTTVEKSELIELLKSTRSDRPEQIENVERELFFLQKLAVGKLAPELEGSDLDGASFKLSDYRGQVVMLNFWSDS